MSDSDRDSTTNCNKMNMITLKSNDGGVFEVPDTVAKQSELIRAVLEDPNFRKYFENFIRVPKVTAPILSKVIEYCRKHADAADASSSSTRKRISELELWNWDRQFVDVDQATLCDLTMAANFLEIKRLQHALLIKAVDIIMGFIMKWAILEENR